jgi:hypothetical protein
MGPQHGESLMEAPRHGELVISLLLYQGGFGAAPKYLSILIKWLNECSLKSSPKVHLATPRGISHGGAKARRIGD